MVRSSLLAAVAVLGVAACTSNPGPKTVAEDVVDGLVEDGDLTASQQDCLQEKLNGYSDDQLNAIAAGNEELNYGPDFDLQSATPAFQEFVANLETCVGSGGG